MACTGPSLSSAFRVLGGAGQDKLLYLKHKLRTLRPGGRGADLLYAMVLLALGQETEARISLEALQPDAVARLVARRWAGADGGVEATEEPPDVAWAVARLYHLLAEEKLCLVPMRDEAYRAALHVFGARDDPRLRELQEEARDRCGWDVAGDPGHFQPLHSSLGCLPPSSTPPSRTRSLPQPIQDPSGWSRGCSLRSTGSPVSLTSNLEISQSPTVALLSQHRSPRGPSKLCGEPLAPEPEPVPAAGQEPEEMSWPSSADERADSPVPPTSPAPGLPEVTDASPAGPSSAADAPGLPQATDASPAGPSSAADAPGTGTHSPVECTEAPQAPAPESLPSPPRSTCPVEDPEPLQTPVEDAASPAAQPSPPTSSAPRTSPPDPSLPWPPPPAAPASSSPSPHPPCPGFEPSEQKFFSFVVLHARADEHIALRVRERLEALGVPDGATFCEDFQVPGRGRLRCLQDAIDHSAFTVLLLTANFDCRLSQHQLGQSLMSSLTRPGWEDCVVPLLPREASRAQLSPATAGLLAGLEWLQEHSPIFHRKVANTFRPRTLRARRAHWQKEQDARALRERQEHLEGERQRAAAVSAAYAACVQAHAAWQAQVEQLQAAFRSHMPFGAQVPSGGLGAPPPLPTWPSYPPPTLPPWLLGTPSPASPQPPAFPPAPPAPPQSPGLQPLIIHHAQMVQLGLNNHMWNQRGAPAPEDPAREAE